MREVALVFDRNGRSIYWHAPRGASSVALPDDRALWEVLWEHRKDLAGVAHTHPGTGIPWPSREDVTTWSAVEAALGKRLLWPIVTADSSAWFGWVGRASADYGWVVTEVEIDLVGLRERSGFVAIDAVQWHPGKRRTNR